MKPPGLQRILVVEDEDSLRMMICRVLEKEGFEAVPSSNGRHARELMALDRFDAVLSDIHMPGSQVSGIDLYQYAGQLKQTPVVLMTAFATRALTEELRVLGATELLIKPIGQAELLGAMKRICGFEATVPRVLPVTDENYFRLDINDFISGRQAPCDLYIRLSDSKYLKIVHQGQGVDLEQLEGYKKKGVRHLHLTRNDFHAYMQLSLGLAKLVQNSTKITREKKLSFLKHTGEVLLEHIHSEDIAPEQFNCAKQVVETMVSFLVQSDEGITLLEALNSHCDFLYARSLGVSLFGTMIAREVGWNSPSTLYKVCMAGLLLDIGKKEIDRTTLMKPRNSMTSDEVRLIETHPNRGMAILSRVQSVPSDLLQVVLQHHERDLGTGYPAGLGKSKIQPLARLLAVADEFCDLVVQGPDHAALKPADAISRLEVLYGNSLDPSFMGALKRVSLQTTSLT